MPSFGDKLKRERESRNTPLEDVARRTRIGIQYLEALERGDFDGLPGRRGFGKLYIRVYADLFGFDPKPLISEYDQERLEQELPNAPIPQIEPARPRKIRFVPRARKSPATEEKEETPATPVEEPVPDPATSPMQATEPVDQPVDSRDAGTVAPAEAVASSAASEVPAEPCVVSEAGPTEPSASSATEAVASMTEGAPSWKRWIVGGAVVLVALGALGVTLKMSTPRPVNPADPESPATAAAATLRFGGDDAEIGQDAAAPPVASAPSEASQVEPALPTSPNPPPISTAPAQQMPQAAESRPLDITEFELGTGVVNRRLADVRREFEEGEVASFLTRVRGGAPGQAIHHAWIRDGRLVQSIELQLGSPSWRTYSQKTLWDAGDWAVEARDENGKVLARVEFRCVPAGR